jgi:adenylate kinase family enzyme
LLKLLRLAKPAPATAAEPEHFGPWRLVAVVGLGLAGFGLGRLALGLAATARVVRRSTPVTDPGLHALAEALDGMLDGLGRKIASVVVLEVGLDELVRRLSGRRVCRAADHVYHVEFHPPAVEGVCDIDGSELYQRDDDREDVIRARYEKQWVAAATPVLDYYTGQGLVARIDASVPREDVGRSVDALIDGLDGRT